MQNKKENFECSSKQKCVKNVKNSCLYNDWCLYKVVKKASVKKNSEK